MRILRAILAYTNRIILSIDMPSTYMINFLKMVATDGIKNATRNRNVGIRPFNDGVGALQARALLNKKVE